MVIVVMAALVDRIEINGQKLLILIFFSIVNTCDDVFFY